MALLHFDGFDNYAVANDLGAEYNTIASAQYSTTAGRYGGGAFAYGGSGGGLRRWLGGAAYADLWMSFAFFPNDGGTGYGGIATFMTDNGFEFGVDFQSTDGRMQVGQVSGTSFGRIADTGTPLATSGTLVNPRAWHWFDIRCVFGDAPNGAIEVWCDGIQIINLTGIDTRRTTATGGWTEVTLGARNNFNGAANSRIFDDLVIYTGTRLGDCKVLTLTPNSDAGPNVGVGSAAGAHYLLVDELAPNLTDYIELDATVTDQREMFGMTDISTTLAIYGVKTNAFTFKSDAADVLFASVLKSGSAELVGPTAGALIGSNNKSSVLAETDPATGAAWTQSGVNALVAGVKTV